MNNAHLMVASALVLGLLTGCSQGNSLTVTGGDPISYQCEQGKKVQVRYFSLSDDSLNFIKLSLPDGKDYTLPQAMSASGARYTDDHEAVWWNKGDEGFVEMRDDNGEWQTVYRDCKQQ
ncbi:MliC family protein [Aeromonas sp. MdU4]|uniref:MliC family protein n=1 Tax=Aeromonas sp. MdU4 TaxID=3342819 RepID=UPI0035B7D6CC